MVLVERPLCLYLDHRLCFWRAWQLSRQLFFFFFIRVTETCSAISADMKTKPEWILNLSWNRLWQVETFSLCWTLMSHSFERMRAGAFGKFSRPLRVSLMSRFLERLHKNTQKITVLKITLKCFNFLKLSFFSNVSQTWMSLFKAVYTAPRQI